MKYLTIIFLFLTSGSYSQTEPEKTISQTLKFDTILQPDYYSVKIAVAEYVVYEGTGKKTRARLISLDSAVFKLQEELGRMRFTPHLRKSAIVEKSSRLDGRIVYFDDRVLFEVTLDFELGSRDSLEYLFANINKEMLRSFTATPRFYTSTLNSARDLLTSRSWEETKKLSEKIALENKQQIIKQTHTHLNFYTNPPLQNHSLQYNSYGQKKQFVVFLDNVEYSLNITCSYILEDL